MDFIAVQLRFALEDGGLDLVRIRGRSPHFI
jgi:hypothetical protein